MNKSLSILPICLLFAVMAWAQKNKKKEKLSDEDTKELLSNVNIDSTSFLRQAALTACSCIDSINQAEKDNEKKKTEISDCIDKQVEVYQMMIKMFHTLTSSDNKIIINTNKNSDEYKHYYFDLERWLQDSCKPMNQIMGTNDEAREKSYSSNSDAKNAYNKGNDFLRQENYKDAIPLFEKAVAIDSEFAFAWDNLGICYRRTSEYDKAIAAYKNSLRVDPQGKTPLQNLAVVYQLQNKPDEAITTYNEILKYYPGDPEVYYGVGLVYYSVKKDMENALQNMCKAYNIYSNQKSPYRSDAEKVINLIYTEMKKNNREDVFNRILKENNIHGN